MKIVVIGPRSVGKSTVSKLLAERINMKRCETDVIMNERMKEHGGITKVIQSGNAHLILEQGFDVIDEILLDDNIILDLAAGSIASRTGYKMGVCQKVIERLNEDDVNLIVLKPFEDFNRSVDLLFLRERNREHFKDMDKDVLLEKVKRNYRAFLDEIENIKHYNVFVGDKSPEKIVDEITGVIFR